MAAEGVMGREDRPLALVPLLDAIDAAEHETNAISRHCARALDDLARVAVQRDDAVDRAEAAERERDEAREAARHADEDHVHDVHVLTVDRAEALAKLARVRAILLTWDEPFPSHRAAYPTSPPRLSHCPCSDCHAKNGGTQRRMEIEAALKESP